MARRIKNSVSLATNAKRWLALAAQRVTLPPGPYWVTYQSDVDTLYIRLKEKTSPTHSEGDYERGVIYDYEGQKLVGLEILDITGQLEHANPQ